MSEQADIGSANLTVDPEAFGQELPIAGLLAWIGEAPHNAHSY